MSIFAFDLVVLGIFLALFYSTSSGYSSNVVVTIESYRSGACAKSGSAPLATRVTFIAPTTSRVCIQRQIVGLQDGAVYASGYCVNRSSAIIIRIRTGQSQRECESMAYTEFPDGSCVPTSALFRRLANETTFVGLDCGTIESAEARFAAFKKINADPTESDNTRASAVTANLLQPWSDASPLTSKGPPYFLRRVQTLQISIASSSHPCRLESILGASTFVGPIDGMRLVAVTPQSFSLSGPFSITNGLEASVETQLNNIPLNATAPFIPRDGDYPLGFIYNNFGSAAQELIDMEAGPAAARYYSMRGSLADIGTQFTSQLQEGDGFTISMYLRATEATQGFAFAIADAREDMVRLFSPLINRLISMLSNADRSSWYNTTYNIYSALYVDGSSDTLRFVYANALVDAGGVPQAGVTPATQLVDLTWDLKTIGVDDFFNGEWHHVAVILRIENALMKAQLVIDGKTSGSLQEWNQCIPRGPVPIQHIGGASLLPVINYVDERVLDDGVAFVGYFNGGVAHLSFTPGVTNQFDLWRTLPVTVRNHNAINATAFESFGYFLVSICIVLVCVMFFSFVRVMVAESKTETEDDRRASFDAYTQLWASGPTDPQSGTPYTYLRWTSAKTFLQLNDNEFAIFLDQLKHNFSNHALSLVTILYHAAIATDDDDNTGDDVTDGSDGGQGDKKKKKAKSESSKKQRDIPPTADEWVAIVVDDENPETDHSSFGRKLKKSTEHEPEELGADDSSADETDDADETSAQNRRRPSTLLTLLRKDTLLVAGAAEAVSESGSGSSSPSSDVEVEVEGKGSTFLPHPPSEDGDEQESAAFASLPEPHDELLPHAMVNVDGEESPHTSSPSFVIGRHKQQPSPAGMDVSASSSPRGLTRKKLTGFEGEGAEDDELLMSIRSRRSIVLEGLHDDESSSCVHSARSIAAFGELTHGTPTPRQLQQARALGFIVDDTGGNAPHSTSSTATPPPALPPVAYTAVKARVEKQRLEVMEAYTFPSSEPSSSAPPGHNEDIDAHDPELTRRRSDLARYTLSGIFGDLQDLDDAAAVAPGDDDEGVSSPFQLPRFSALLDQPVLVEDSSPRGRRARSLADSARGARDLLSVRSRSRSVVLFDPDEDEPAPPAFSPGDPKFSRKSDLFLKQPLVEEDVFFEDGDDIPVDHLEEAAASEHPDGRQKKRFNPTVNADATDVGMAANAGPAGFKLGGGVRSGGRLGSVRGVGGKAGGGMKLRKGSFGGGKLSKKGAGDTEDGHQKKQDQGAMNSNPGKSQPQQQPSMGDLVSPALQSIQNVGLWMTSLSLPPLYNSTFRSGFSIASLDFAAIVQTPGLTTPIVQLFISFVVVGALLYYIDADEHDFSWNLARYVVRRDQLDLGLVTADGDDEEDEGDDTKMRDDSVAKAAGSASYNDVISTLFAEKGASHRKFVVPVLSLKDSQRVDLFLGRSKVAGHEDLREQKSMTVQAADGTTFNLEKTLPEEKSNLHLYVTCTPYVATQLFEVGYFCRCHRRQRLVPHTQTEAWPYRNRASCCVSMNGIRCNISVGRMFRCTHEDESDAQCSYAVCEDHFRAPVVPTIIGELIANKRLITQHGLDWFIVTILMTAANSCYMPFVKTALMILACSSYYQCQFTQCWAGDDQVFLLAAYLCIVMITMFGIGFPGGLSYLLWRRSKMLGEIFFADEYGDRFINKDDGEVKPTEWARFVLTDSSNLGKLYKTFELKWIYLPPILVGWKVLLIVPAVFLEKDSLTQYVGIGLVQLAYALFLFVTKPSSLPVVDFMLKLGALHALIIFGLLTVDVRQQYEGAQSLDNTMVMISSVYLVICSACVVYSSVVPVLRAAIQKHRITQLMEKFGMHYNNSTGLYVVPAEQPLVDGSFKPSRKFDFPDDDEWTKFGTNIVTRPPSAKRGRSESVVDLGSSVLQHVIASSGGGAGGDTASVFSVRSYDQPVTTDFLLPIRVPHYGCTTKVYLNPSRPPPARGFAMSVNKAVFFALVENDPSLFVFETATFPITVVLVEKAQEIPIHLGEEYDVAWLCEELQRKSDGNADGGIYLLAGPPATSILEQLANDDDLASSENSFLDDAEWEYYSHLRRPRRNAAVFHNSRPPPSGVDEAALPTVGEPAHHDPNGDAAAAPVFNLLVKTSDGNCAIVVPLNVSTIVTSPSASSYVYSTLTRAVIDELCRVPHQKGNDVMRAVYENTARFSFTVCIGEGLETRHIPVDFFDEYTLVWFTQILQSHRTADNTENEPRGRLKKKHHEDVAVDSSAGSLLLGVEVRLPFEDAVVDFIDDDDDDDRGCSKNADLCETSCEK